MPTILSLRDELARLPTFRGIEATAVTALADRSTVRSFAPGKTLFREGTPAAGIYIVLKGEVRVVRSSRGRRHVIHHETRGGALGEVPVFDGAAYPATAIARTDLRCAYVGRTDLARAVRECPDLAWFFLRRLSGRIRTLVDRVDDLATRDLSMRLAAYLTAKSNGDHPAVVAITQEALAEELGTVREVVVRALRHLRQARIIESAGRGKIAVLDRRRLREIAGDR